MTTPATGPPLRVAVLDLYNGEPNHGMRALRELLAEADGRYHGQRLSFDIFETRLKNEVPGLDYDVYISSGGPGSPFDGEGTAWERAYFALLDGLWNHNARRPGAEARHVLFICHSYQLMCRFFEVARVIRRRSESFGIFPVHKTAEGEADPLFKRLPDPFFAADFRHWQVVEPDARRMQTLGAEVLALEKPRRHVPLERATMAMRLTPEIVGVQFHPEADPPGMLKHFAEPRRRKLVVRRHGVEKYERIIRRMADPSYLKRTHDAVLPNFLRGAVEALRPEASNQKAA